MKAFLDKLSQLSSVETLMLLSLEEELLHLHPPAKVQSASSNTDLWHSIIDGLGHPENADFIYEKRRVIVTRLALGNLLVILNDDTHVKMIKEGCKAVREKLKDGSILKNVLLRMFSENSRRLRPAHIKMLRPVAGPDVVSMLSPILVKADTIHSARGMELIVAACQVLGHCRTPEALTVLKDYHRRFGQESPHEEAVQAAKIAIAQLQLDDLDTPRSGSIELDILGPEETRDVFQNGDGDLSPIDLKIKELVEGGDKAEAINLVLASIRKKSAQKDFTQAERYRQMLIAIDSMALREIIRAAEIIEEAKSASISETLLSTWEGLVRELSLEEFSALYFATELKNSPASEVLVEQGDFLSRLYFVNSGRVQLYTVQNGRDMTFKTVEEGEIFGADCFFDISVWTFSAKSLGASLMILKWDQLAALKQDYPSLQKNLQKYCDRFQNNHLFFQKPSTSRRKYERRELKGRASMSLLDGSGIKSGEVVRGDLLDLSQGGVCFVLRFHRKEKANELLGRQVSVTIKPANLSRDIDKTGIIRAVRAHDFVGNDYSVHLQFDDIIEPTDVSRATAKKSE